MGASVFFTDLYADHLKAHLFKNSAEKIFTLHHNAHQLSPYLNENNFACASSFNSLMCKCFLDVVLVKFVEWKLKGICRIFICFCVLLNTKFSQDN